METMVRWRSELTAVDFGNAPIDNLSVERSMPPIRRMVREIAETGAIPIIIGGDHSIEYPNVAGLADVYGKENVGVIHFDAHFDGGDVRNGHLISHAQPVRRLVDDGHVLGQNYIQVGLRGGWPAEDGFEWMRENNMRYHTMAEIQKRGSGNVLKRVRREVDRGPDAFFVSVDVSALAPTEMIAAGRVEAHGLSIEEVTQAIRHVCAAKDIVGFEITDLAPMMDLSDLSVIHANAVLNACLVGVAVRKAGLDPDYVHPLVLGHGQR